MSEVGTALHRRPWETCRGDMMEEGSTAAASTSAASTSVASTSVGSVAVAVMAIYITTIKLVACPADRRLLNREACWDMVVAGSTVVADMDIPITTIKLEAHRADRRRACTVKEEGIITEGGSTVKVEG